MTARGPSRPRPTWLLGLLILPLLLGVARAGPDDFEFGQKLAENRYFDFARRVYQSILADPNRADADKDKARYGLALLNKDEAIAMTGRADVGYADVKKAFDSAVKDVAEFAKKYGETASGPQAKLDVGTIRLAFVQWARDLVEDQAELAARSTTAQQVTKDAKEAVDDAIEYFGGLRPAASATEATPLQELAQYYYVICQYYRALVFPACSSDALTALERAAEQLDNYIITHDGQLLAVYAQDILGLVWWERAKCERQPAKRAELFGFAFEWFVTCVDTPDMGPDFLKVITSGYYHLAQAGLSAGKLEGRDFQREAVDYLRDMLKKHPTAWRTESGLRALVEWSKIECERGVPAKAVEVAKDAAERAKVAGLPHIERVANRQLNVYVSGGCGSSLVGQDPDVLRRVADDLFSRERYADAVKAYRQVIASTPESTDAFMNHRWHAWERSAIAYRRLSDRLGEALAYEPIHDAWMNGLIPRDPNRDDDPNMIRAGNNRRAAQQALKELYEQTQSKVFETRYKDVATEFIQDYPLHPSTRVGEWNAAMDKWNSMRDKKRQNNLGWRQDLAEAQGHLRNVSKDMKAEKQDSAWVFLVMAERETDDPKGQVERADEAFGYWNHPDRKAQEEQYETVRGRRTQARAAVTFWKAEGLAKLGRTAEVVELLKDYDQRYPDAEEVYASMAHGLLVESLIDAKDIEEADRHYRTLLREHPKFFNLPNITFKLAGFYNEIRSKIEERLRAVVVERNKHLPEMRKAEREVGRLQLLLADLNNRRSKYDEAVAAAEKQEKEGQPLSRELGNFVIEARRELPALREKIASTTKAFEQISATADELEKKVKALREQEEALKQEIYEPLVKAADYYKELDDTFKADPEAKDKRSVDNLAIFGQMFWFAGTLRPQEVSNWRKARSLYEDFLADPRVKAKPLSDADKRNAVARLGDAYVNLAEREQDPAARRELVTRAVDLLQNSIADQAANNELVVGMLSNKLLILSWRDNDTMRRYRFPIPRPANVEDLKDRVAKLGTPGGFALPVFGSAEKDREYQEKLRAFKIILARESNDALQKLVDQAAAASFDEALYKELANSTPEFMLAIAWAYIESGREEDLPKAVNLLSAMVSSGALKLEDDSPEAWRAETLLLRSYLASSQTGSAATGAESKAWLDRAATRFKAVAANFPDFGESVVPGNEDRWMRILEDLNSLRSRAGLLPVTVETRPQ